MHIFHFLTQIFQIYDDKCHNQCWHTHFGTICPIECVTIVPIAVITSRWIATRVWEQWSEPLNRWQGTASMKANVVVAIVISGTILTVAWTVRVEHHGRELSWGVLGRGILRRGILRRGNVRRIVIVVVVIIRVVREGHFETILFDDDFTGTYICIRRTMNNENELRHNR